MIKNWDIIWYGHCHYISRHESLPKDPTVVESKYELMTRELSKIAWKRFMMFSCITTSRQEHIKERHELRHKKWVKSH